MSRNNPSERSPKADALFLQAEHRAKDFDLFPNSDLPSPAKHIEGLISEEQIRANLQELRGLDVDSYIQRAVQPSKDKRRPSARDIVAGLNARLLHQSSQGPLYCAELDMDFGQQWRRIGIVAQDRQANNGAWMPEHHHAAAEMVRRYAELRMPIVYLIDTPGADAGEAANRNNQAHSISRLIAETTNVDVPTLGIVIGEGYSGGAIPLAAANLLLSLRDGTFNTIQPQGLQSIARKYKLSWQECAQCVGVSPEELTTQGFIDGVIDYSPLDKGASQHNLQRALISGIQAIEQAAVEFVRQSPDMLEHYARSLQRYLHPSERLLCVQNASALMLASNPSSHTNVFGLCFRYMRYLTLRGRIHSQSVTQYGRLSHLSVPEGDLDSRIAAMHAQAFRSWLDSPDKLIYDNDLANLWKQFQAKREEIGEDRNALSRLIRGEPKNNYEQAKKALLFNLTLSLYNRWKSSATNNLHALIDYLTGDELAETQDWPALSDLSIIDVVAHPELREEFLVQCRHILVFDSLYDKAVANLASIAHEAMEHRSLSRDSVGQLLENALDQTLGRAEPGTEVDALKARGKFGRWLRYLLKQAEGGDLLSKVESWKRIGYPQMNDSLFVILTYYFEKLLPSYFASADKPGDFKGVINPVRIGRRKDFWNRLTMGYQDLLIQAVQREEKRKSAITTERIIARFLSDFVELDGDRMSANALNFPGFRLSIEDALDKGIKPCGLITGLADFKLPDGETRRVGVALSNTAFQVGAFDMASAEKFCALLVECAQRGLPVLGFISSGGMQTKEGAGALFSMAVVNDRITRFVRDTELPLVIFGYGDCTGGAQASFVTHPLAQNYYLSGTNMPFAGQMVVPSYLPSSSTLSNYLSQVPGAMAELLHNPFSDTLNDRLRQIDSRMPMPTTTIEQVVQRALAGHVPSPTEQTAEPATDPRALMQPVKKVLIHARGCTAVKLIRKAQEADIQVVLVASDPDMDGVPADMLREQDRLVCLGGNTSDESYLNAHSVLNIAAHEQVDALHPGIGFLSESPQFAALCTHNGINFIGPSAASMSTMGNKSNAIKTAMSVKVPVVPGSHGILSDVEQAEAIAAEIGYPVLLKAVQGGGGKGIQVVEKPELMQRYFQQISAEARAAFGNGDLYLEKYVTSMRHIEAQLLRDSHGNSKVLGLRDCSVQRNNQKVFEESGSTMLPEGLKQQVFDYTRALGEAVDYIGAGTVEFIYDLDANAVYFMEMNTRLQVEHPVTEATSGIDIVKAQFDIASGHSIADLQPQTSGYAMEVRVTAEKAKLEADGSIGLVPSPGKVVDWQLPERDDVELIAMVEAGKEISPYYDSLIAQVIMRGRDREDVINKLLAYLDSVQIKGISSNIPLLKGVLQDPTFRGGNYDTNYLPQLMAKLDAEALIAEMEAMTEGQALDRDALKVDASDELKVIAQSPGIFYTTPSPDEPNYVDEGDVVCASDTLCLMEAMKMFTQLSLNSFNRKDQMLYDPDAKFRVERVMNSNGAQVSPGDLLFIVRPVPD
ncbi:MAG: ATP-grasp domain-containing protein [Oceanococcus sp.]|nr:MAG: ATP-grasp domain-containing protein [Oceanococcus sp.]